MEYLLNTSERSVILAALAALCCWPVKSASVKHAVWTLVTAGMLLQLLLSPMLPTLPLPVLRPVEAVAAVPVTFASAPMAAPEPRPAHSPFPLIPAIYCAGLLFFAARLGSAFRFTRRIVRNSERIAPGQYQSREIAVPLTTGARILLPVHWAEWEPAKLRDVLAHEQAHVRRGDSRIALLARVNRCVFWFHPLAWWLERELAQLAEQACDDAALAVVEDRRRYAQTLLDMARAVRASQGRLLTSAMAKETNVETRINRILDETRRIPRALGRAGWAALLTCAAPLVYMAAAVQLAPAQTAMAIPAPAAPQPPLVVSQVQQAQTQQPAQAPSAEQTQGNQNPDARHYSKVDLERQFAELQNRLLLAQGRMVEARKAAAQDQDASESQREELQRLQEQLLRAQQARQVAQAPQPAQAQSQDDIEATRQKLADALARLDQLARAQQALAQKQNPADAQVSVRVSEERTVTLTFPLGEGGEHVVSYRITRPDGSLVAAGGYREMNPSWDFPLQLKPGTYHLSSVISNSADGRTMRRELDFEVK